MQGRNSPEDRDATFAEETTFKGSLSRYTDSVRQYIESSLSLINKEARLAVLSLLELAGVAVILAVLAVSAWLCLLAALGLWFISLGLAPVLTVLLGAILNIGLMLLLAWRAKLLSGNLQFSRTLALLQPDAQPQAESANEALQPEEKANVADTQRP